MAAMEGTNAHNDVLIIEVYMYDHNRHKRERALYVNLFVRMAVSFSCGVSTNQPFKEGIHT